MQYFHVWFSTKYRKPLLIEETEKLVKDIFKDCMHRHGYMVLEFETNVDHVHMLLEVKDKAELAGIMRTIKAVSGREILKTAYFLAGNIKHFWARKYGYKEIEKDEIVNIMYYIRAQKKMPHTGVCG